MRDNIQFIGLPYHWGQRGALTGYRMDEGVKSLLHPEAVPRLMGEAGFHSTTEWIVDVDEPDDRHHNGDPRMLPPGDAMGRMQAQNITLAAHVRGAREAGRFPAVVAGNCNSSLGVVAGLDDPDVGMFWFDTHDDARTPETSTNGLFDGMPVTTIAGHCWQAYREQIPGFHVIPENRMSTVGDFEAYTPGGRARASKIRPLGHLVDPPAIKLLGFEGAMAVAIDAIAEEVQDVYVHFDVDVMDGRIMMGNRHAAQDGLSVAQAIQGVQMIASRLHIAALNVCAWDPFADERSAKILIPLAAQMFGIACRSGKPVGAQ